MVNRTRVWLSLSSRSRLMSGFIGTKWTDQESIDIKQTWSPECVGYREVMWWGYSSRNLLIKSIKEMLNIHGLCWKRIKICIGGTPKGRERSCNIQEQEQEDGPCSSKLLSMPYKTNAVISYRVDRLNDDDFSLACTEIVQYSTENCKMHGQ